MSACSICSSRAQAGINAALLRGDTLTKIAERYGVSRYAVRRHREGHLYDPAGVPSRSTEPPSLSERLTEIEHALAGALQAAHRRGSTTSLVSTARELRGVLEAIWKLRVEERAEKESVELTFHEQMRSVRQALVMTLGPEHPELLEVFERHLERILTDDLARKVAARTDSRPIAMDIFD